MNDIDRQSQFDNPELFLETAVQAVQAESFPDDAVERVRDRAMRLAVPTPTPRNCKSIAGRSKFYRSIVGALAAAAMVAITAAGPAFMLDRSVSRAFAQMVEKVKAANTVQFHASFQFDKHTSSGTLYRDGNRTRAEMGDGAYVSITDIDSRTVLNLYMKHKQYQRSRMSQFMAEQSVNPVDRLRLVKTDGALFVGEENLDGRRASVYRLENADILNMGRNGLETKVWIDFESKLPAKIFIRDPDPNHEMKIQYDNFVWDQLLDPKLFSLEAPEDFGVIVELPAEPIEATGAAKGLGNSQPISH